MPLSSTVELLIAAFRPDTDPALWQAQLQSADTDNLAVSALVLGLAPLLAWRLSGWGITLPPRAAAKLQAGRQASALRQQAIEAQLADVLAACAREQIALIVLKGAYLATHFYPDAGTRPMNDIDVLVRRKQLPALEVLLKRLGYGAHYKAPDTGARVVKHTSTFRKPDPDAATPNPYLSAGSTHTVEPHTSLEESWFGLRADITPGVWERSVPAGIGAHDGRALCPSDLLLHLCVHLTFHLVMGYPSLVQLLDLLWVSRTLSEDDWHATVERSMAQQVSGFISAALRLARLSLHAPISDDALCALGRATPARVRAHAETLSLDDVLRRTQRPPLTTLAQRIRRGLVERAECDRWAATPAQRAAIWGTLVDMRRTDTGQSIGARLREVF